LRNENGIELNHRAKLCLFFAARMFGLFRVAAYLTRGKLRILCYHGIELEDECRFRPKLFIKASTLEQRLRIVRRYGYRVISLGAALAHLDGDSAPANSVVVTVDDGFSEFMRVGVPLLQRYGFPATIYLTTYYVLNPNPIFRLVVQYMFWRSTVRDVGLRDVPWSVDKVVDLSDPQQRHEVTWACINYGERVCDEAGRVAVCERLGKLLGVSYAEIVASRKFHLMTPDEVRSLDGSEISIQMHTHRHVFPADDKAAAQREVTDNRHWLAQWTSESQRHFCYPSGLWHERQAPWLAELGIVSAASCVLGMNDAQTSRYALRRLLDGENLHHLEFEAALTGFSDVLRRLLFGSTDLEGVAAD
jgi:peptidoglycan/xylan/chitin deacetylase (PgdA/CDA1 family)